MTVPTLSCLAENAEGCLHTHTHTHIQTHTHTHTLIHSLTHTHTPADARKIFYAALSCATYVTELRTVAE